VRRAIEARARKATVRRVPRVIEARARRATVRRAPRVTAVADRGPSGVTTAAARLAMIFGATIFGATTGATIDATTAPRR
jgi:hypothetical protein